MRRGRARSFAPRYPSWLAAPLLGYYLLLFVAPLAILVAFALAKQGDSFAGSQIIYGFYTDAISQVFDSLYVNVFKQTFLMAAGGTQALEWESEASSGGGAARAWLRTKANSIEGGTSEIQLNIIAKRILELPS